jgi:hypothetical protein
VLGLPLPPQRAGAAPLGGRVDAVAPHSECRRMQLTNPLLLLLLLQMMMKLRLRRWPQPRRAQADVMWPLQPAHHRLSSRRGLSGRTRPRTATGGAS